MSDAAGRVRMWLDAFAKREGRDLIYTVRLCASENKHHTFALTASDLRAIIDKDQT